MAHFKYEELHPYANGVGHGGMWYEKGLPFGNLIKELACSQDELQAHFPVHLNSIYLRLYGQPFWDVQKAAFLGFRLDSAVPQTLEILATDPDVLQSQAKKAYPHVQEYISDLVKVLILLRQYQVIGDSSRQIIERVVPAFGFSMNDVPVIPRWHRRRFLSDEAILKYTNGN